MVTLQDLKRISEYEWEIPKTFREDMRVPVRLFATKEILEAIMDDKSLEQAVNSATLPGLVSHLAVMPDMHQGYGFPIGAVAASRTADGIISPGGIGYDINCLAGDSLVLHEHGYTRRMDEMAEMWPEATLACFQLDRCRYDVTPIVRWFGRPPHAPVFRLTTEAGDELTATADHPFWTEDGMIPLARISIGDRIAIFPFRGIPYETPKATVCLTAQEVEAYLRQRDKRGVGNTVEQNLNQLRRLKLLGLRYSSTAVPYLCKILGFVFGNGAVRFDQKLSKGSVVFYGSAEDLDDIRTDILRLGFNPRPVRSRHRAHKIEAVFDENEFERAESWFTVNSTAFAALLACLGAPVGDKTRQNYLLPAWLKAAPLWQKRLFLAALFGARLSAPQAMSRGGRNFTLPRLSLHKREGFEDGGSAFLAEIAGILAELGVKAQEIAPRIEQTSGDSSRFVRLNLAVGNDAENLQRLWGTVGVEYRRKHRALAAIAVQYLARKQRHVAARQEIERTAVALAPAGGVLQEIITHRIGSQATGRFAERSWYGAQKSSPRVDDTFPTFEEFRSSAGEGLGDSGMVWERIANIEPLEYAGLVYDFTVDHPDHNFVANSFVVSNCGVRLLASHIAYETVEDYLDDLATALNHNCPSGVGEKGAVRVTDAELDQVCREGARWAHKQGYATREDLRRTEEEGKMEGADPAKVSKRARERGRPQLGSLGAGNHFIEVEVVEHIFDPEAAEAMGLVEGNLAVQIHCGSRGFGHQICTDYVDEFQEAVRRYGIRLPDRELVCAPLNSPEGQNYLAAMRCAANYAFTNRQILAHQIRKAFEEVLAGKVADWHLHPVYDIAHNMGKIEKHTVSGARIEVCVHRKGATRAFGPGFEGLPPEYRAIGQPVLVPGSMGTASWVLVGTEISMERSFGSTCHGAGRVMSRNQAKKSVRGDDLKKKLESKGIHVRAGSLPGLAEEAPQAYKDVDAVVETVAGARIARKVARLVPVAVIKG